MNDLYQVRDSLQLIDPELMTYIASLDIDGLWKYVLDNIEPLRSLKKFKTGFLHALPDGMERLETVFHRFCKEDGLEEVKQCMVRDVGFIGEEIVLHELARCGYLDHPSSAEVQTSNDLLPLWDPYEDYEVHLFDILDADHVSLMAEAMRKNQAKIEPDKYLDYLKIEVIEKACRKNPTLRAAYIYDTR